MAGSIERFLDNQPAVNRNGPQDMTRAVWGGVAQEFDTLQGEVKEISSDTAVIENVTGEMLDEVILRFTGIPRITNESDESRMKTLYAFFRRSGNRSWGTIHAIRDAFLYFFSAPSIYLLENVIETNLISEGGFEEYEEGVKVAPFGDWVPTGSSIEVVTHFAFQGAKSVKGTGTGVLSQTVSALAGSHILTTAYLGALDVSVQRLSDNWYWDFSTKTWAAPVAKLALINSGELYKLNESAVVIDADSSIKISYSRNTAGTEFYVDNLSFGAKPPYPFIKVIISTFGQSGDFLNNWPGTDDPVLGTDYDNATFFGMDFIGGEGGGFPTAFYQMILDYVKTAGVKAVFEFVGRE